MSWLSDLIGNGAGSIIDSITDGVDKFITTDEERAELELKKQQMRLRIQELQIEAEREYFKDRESARRMQSETDSKIPGALTLIFSVSFFGLIVFLLLLLFKKIDTEIPNYIVALISSIFGSVATIMTQIISFYFGSSKGGEDSGRAISNSFKVAASQGVKR